MNNQIVELPNGDFEVLNENGSVQGMPQKVYPLFEIKKSDKSTQLYSA